MENWERYQGKSSPRTRNQTAIKLELMNKIEDLVNQIGSQVKYAEGTMLWFRLNYTMLKIDNPDKKAKIEEFIDGLNSMRGSRID